MENELNTIMLMNDEGKEVEFEVIDFVTVEKNEYLIATPMDEEEDYAIVFKVSKDENEEEVLELVEDEAILEEVRIAYESDEE